ncbi:hypothetical protein HK098_006795 [Nowakowskiella sp. JEL0407]|nr:hypothetical protein HK098_006795 [Nowakowskiella sp. JEL0407]
MSKSNATPLYTVDRVIDNNTANDPSDPPPIYTARNNPKKPRNCNSFFTKRNIIIFIAVLVVVTLSAILIPLFATGSIWIPSSNQPIKYFPNLCKEVKIHNGTYTLSVAKMLPKGDKVYILCEYDGKDVPGGSIIELDTTKNQTSTIYTTDTDFVDLTFARSVLGENTDQLYSANINGSVQSHDMKTLATTPIEFGGVRKNQTVVSFLPYLSRADLSTNMAMRTITDFDENLLLFYLPDTIANQTSYSAFRGLDISSQGVKSTLSLWKKASNESKFSDISNFTKALSDFKANPLKMLMIRQMEVDVPYLIGYARISPKDNIYLSSLGYSPNPYLPSYMHFEMNLTNSAIRQNDPQPVTNIRCPFTVDSLLQVAFQNEQYEVYYSSTFGPPGNYNTSSSARIFAVATDSTGKNYALVEYLLDSSPLASHLIAQFTIQSCQSISITRGGLQGDYIAMKMEDSMSGAKRPGKVSLFFLSWASNSEKVIEEWDGNKGKLKASYIIPGNPGIQSLKVSGSNLYVATTNEIIIYDTRWT